jgi:hypothetical protein
MDEELITGYQFCPDHGEFRCVYKFPNNKDKDEIHLPPYTTLVPPPSQYPSSLIPCWADKEWILKPINEVGNITTRTIPEDDYGKLLPEFAKDQVDFGIWSNETYTKWENARTLFNKELNMNNPMVKTEVKNGGY